MQTDHYQRLRHLNTKMHDINTADNIFVRKEIMSRIRLGIISLSEGQKELAEIQSSARQIGQQTAYD